MLKDLAELEQVEVCSGLGGRRLERDGLIVRFGDLMGKVGMGKLGF